MKKRRLKRWVKVAIATIIIITIWVLVIIGWSKRVEFFNNNIEQCGSNYCEK